MMPADKVATPNRILTTGKFHRVSIGGWSCRTDCSILLMLVMGHKIEVYETHDNLAECSVMEFRITVFRKIVWMKISVRF